MTFWSHFWSHFFFFERCVVLECRNVKLRTASWEKAVLPFLSNVQTPIAPLAAMRSGVRSP